MKANRNFMMVVATFALCAAQGGALARPLAGDGVDKGKTPLDFGQCVREVDRDVSTSGTNQVQFVTRIITLKNFCARSFNVTLDVPYQADPQCERLRPGKTTNFVYSVSTLQPPPQEYRGIKQC